MKLFIPISIIIICAFGSFSKNNDQVVVNVTNIPSVEGSVMVAIQRGRYYQKAEVTSDQVVVTFNGIPDGKYNLAVFHDANSNLRLDMKYFKPVEFCAMKDIVVNDSSRTFNIALLHP